MPRRSTLAAVALTFAAAAGNAHADMMDPFHPLNTTNQQNPSNAANASRMIQSFAQDETATAPKARTETAPAPETKEGGGHPLKWAFGIGIIAAGIVAARRVSKSQLDQHNREYRHDRQP